MYQSIPTKFRLMILAVVSTAIVTSSILAQQALKQNPPGNAKQADGAPAHAGSKTDVVTPPATNAPGVGQDKKQAVANPNNQKLKIVTIASCQLTKFTATPSRGGADISANVTLTDTRPDLKYLWSLTVSDENFTQTFLKRHYAKQMFGIQDVQEGGPTFTEHLKLQPGTYKIRVSLYAIPEGFDLADLKDETVAKAHALVSGLGKVVVPPR
jgi:hypothetical protein